MQEKKDRFVETISRYFHVVKQEGAAFLVKIGIRPVWIELLENNKILISDKNNDVLTREVRLALDHIMFLGSQLGGCEIVLD